MSRKFLQRLVTVGGNSNPAREAMHDYGCHMSLEQLRAAVGQRATIRLHEAGGGFRDIVGVLQSETSLINRRGEIIEFSVADVAIMRVIPVFNRRDASTGELHIYDTLSRKLKPVTSQEGVVAMYCCGPTVYRDAHVGNLRTFLLSDLIARTLQLTGLDVRLIQNITDVGHMSDDFESQDKLLAESARTKVDPFAIAREYESRFHQDLSLLNIEVADKYPRASESMPLIISAIEKLIEKKCAYIGSDGSVYFDATAFPTYGAISGNKLEALKPGHKYEYGGEDGKKFHADWALWKLAGTRTEMIWDSPWGAGFPGWHIECSAMSIDFLDKHVDIHVGGIDLRFPHHENERAQSNSITATEVVDTWVHGEHLLFEGRKMSKSAGNVVLLSDVIARNLDPLALRFSLMENRYRSQMDLSWASLEASHATLKRWRNQVTQWGTSLEIKIDSEITDALTQDLDTPRAMQRLRSVEKDVTIGAQDKRAIFLYADLVLALDLQRAPDNKPLTAQLEEILEMRAQSRAEKNWQKSDELRLELESHGLEINDGPQGQSWSWK